MPGVQARGRKEGSVRELVRYSWFIINCWHSSPCRSQDPACAKQRLDAVLGNVLTRKRAFPSLSKQAEVSPSCVMGMPIKRWLTKCTGGRAAAETGQVSGEEPSTANWGNRVFPGLKPAELWFSRIYHLMAKFWPTITLCSLCQSTYMSCNQSSFFPILPPALPWGGRNCDGLSLPGMARASSQRAAVQILLLKAPGLQHTVHGPTKTNGHPSICTLWQDQGHKYRPWEVGRTLNKLCPKGSGQHQCSEWEVTLLWQRLPAQL